MSSCRTSTSTGRGRAAAAGGRREIRCPADGTLVAEVDEATRRGHRRRDRRRARARSTTARGPRRRPASAATCSCAGRRPARARHAPRSRAPRPSTPASGWSRASTTSTTWSRSSATTATSRLRTPGGSSTPGTPDVVSRIVHEPVGVCGLITPWNYPLLQVVVEGRAVPGRGQHLRAQAQRAHPAHRDPPDAAARGGRAAGRRRATSCSATGAERRRAAVEDPRVDLVSFTGGLATGKRIMAAAAAR